MALQPTPENFRAEIARFYLTRADVCEPIGMNFNTARFTCFPACPRQQRQPQGGRRVRSGRGEGGAYYVGPLPPSGTAPRGWRFGVDLQIGEDVLPPSN